MGYLDGHLLAIVIATMHFAEATRADNLLNVQLLVVNLMGQLHGIRVGDKVAWKNANLRQQKKKGKVQLVSD